MLRRSSSSSTDLTPRMMSFLTSGRTASSDCAKAGRAASVNASAIPALTRAPRIMGPIRAKGGPVADGQSRLLGAPAGRRGAPYPGGLKPGQQHVVVLGRSDPLDQPLHRGRWRHLLKPTAQREHRVELVGAEELLLAAGAARRDVDRGIDPLLGEAPIELDLGVARALELLEDDVVHPRAGLDEGSGDDRQRASAVGGSDRPRRSEER